jgi:hypothetical protein
MATKCADKESENCHSAITFSNNSDMTLYVKEENFYLIDPPDPFDISRLSYFHPGQKNIKSYSVSKDALSSTMCFENSFGGDLEILYIYIFDAAVIKNTSWEVVARDYLVLKRYDLTLKDLQRLNWKIAYPPTEAMKDIKQYPPYGE